MSEKNEGFFDDILDEEIDEELPEAEETPVKAETSKKREAPKAKPVISAAKKEEPEEDIPEENTSAIRDLQQKAVWNAGGWVLPANGWCTAPGCGQKVKQKLFTIDHLVFFDRTNKISQVQLGGMFGTPLFGVPLKVIEFADGKHNPKDFSDVKLNREIIQKQLAVEICQLWMHQSEQVQKQNRSINLLYLLDEIGRVDSELVKIGRDTKLSDATLGRIREMSPELCKQAEALTKLPIIHLSLGQSPSENDRTCAGIQFLRALRKVSTTETSLMLAWRVRTVNGQKVPYELVRLDAGNKVTSIGTCRCAVCAAKQSYLLGAYPQYVTGMLGTTAAGKTSLLAAFADVAADCTAKTDIHIRRLSGNDMFNEQDEQWDMFSAEASGRAKPGGLWCYQHGYSVEKTAKSAREAPPVVLSFLVCDEKNEARNFISTFTDIPGEALYSETGAVDRNYLSKKQPIILQCSSYFVVMSVTQSERLGEQQEGVKDAAMASRMLEIGDNLKAFLASAGENGVGCTPVALLFTKFDVLRKNKKEGEAELPVLMGVANNITTYEPIVVQEDGKYYFNAEPAAHISSATKRFGERYFDPIVRIIEAALEEQKDGNGNRTADKKICFASFPVSAYGYEAPPFTADMDTENIEGENVEDAAEENVSAEAAEVDIDSDEEVEVVRSRLVEKTPEQIKQYTIIKQRRFGVAAPFLWLYTAMDMLTPGSDLWSYRRRMTSEQVEQLRRLQAEELFKMN